MAEHTLKFYGDELNGLKAEVVRMGALAASQIEDSLAAFASRDAEAARTLIARDERIDHQQREIEKTSIRLIALRQPVAQDLRRAVGALKMSLSLERSADLAKNIGKRALVLGEGEPVAELTRAIDRMGAMVLTRFKIALDAYTTDDVAAALGVWNHDREVDASYNALFLDLVRHMAGDAASVASCAHLLFIGKNLERIGDHATSMAEITHYEVTGEEIMGQRPKARDFAIKPAFGQDD